MTRPLMIDLYSKQGAAGMGYAHAGFDVIGVDLDPQPRYPFEFHQADALAVLAALAGNPADALALLADYDVAAIDVPDWLFNVVAVHASPPCQAYTNAQKINGNAHPDLVAPTRELLQATGLPYVIENVPGAPLHDPVELCGAMFGLGTYRHRLFESNRPITAPPHPEHVTRTTKMGRRPQPGEFMHVVGNFSGVAQARKAMGGCEWMTRDGLREAIPPVYAEHLGRQLIEHVREVAA